MGEMNVIMTTTTTTSSSSSSSSTCSMTVEGSSSSNLTPVAPIPVENGAPPPAYTEIDNKTQH